MHLSYSTTATVSVGKFRSSSSTPLKYLLIWSPVTCSPNLTGAFFGGPSGTAFVADVRFCFRWVFAFEQTSQKVFSGDESSYAPLTGPLLPFLSVMGHGQFQTRPGGFPPSPSGFSGGPRRAAGMSASTLGPSCEGTARSAAGTATCVGPRGGGQGKPPIK